MFNHIKKLSLLIGAIAAFSYSGWSQPTGAYVPDTAVLYIPSGGNACLWGDTLQLKGKLAMTDSSSRFYFMGKIWNNDITAMISSGKVIMNDTTRQTIIAKGSYGTGPSFSRLEINNPAGIILNNSHLRVDSQLVFSKGILFTNQNDVLLGRDAVIEQNDPQSFTSVEGGGGISKFTGSDAQFSFPLGAGTAPVYNPLALNVHASAYNPASYIRVAVTDSAHDKKTPRHINYGEKFWTVAFKNMTVDSAAYTASYNSVDQFQGDTAKIAGSVWENGHWSYNASGRIPGNTLAVTGKITADADIFGQDKLLQANTKAILQGPWNGTAMNTTLRSSGLLPTTQPYGAAPYNVAGFNYTGNETRPVLPANAVDWVLLELRSTANGPAIAKSAGILLNNGSIVDGYTNGPVEFSNLADGNYYLVIKHRNHMGVMSATPVTLPNTDVYDFSTSLSQAYGTGAQMATIGSGKFALRGGNVIPDNTIRSTGLPAVNDYTKILALLGSTTNVLSNVYNQADVNLNGSVRATGLPGINDYTQLLNFIGAGVSLILQSF